MEASLPTPMIDGAASYRFDSVKYRRCNSANEVVESVGCLRFSSLSDDASFVRKGSRLFAV